MATEILGRKHLTAITALIVLALAYLSLAAASPAEAQLPAFCEQYPNDPACIDPGGGGGDNPDGDGDTGPGAVSAGTGGDGDGSLPFTGYPLTGLVLLLLALLATGLALRAGMAIRNRMAEQRAR